MCNNSLLGFLNVNKPKGMTSHDVISRLRKITGIKQIGHSGTLDPFATGVLPVAVGKATKLIEYLDDDKEYLATVRFGANTTTYDLEGEITETFDVKIAKTQVEDVIRNFVGEISQVPPIYSAIKVNGKKLYDYARAGQEVDIKSRKVTIYKIELVDFDYDTQAAKILVACSKGTYIRSIAYDLGKELGCGGYLTGLVRTKAGQFFIENSVDLDDIEFLEEVKNSLIYPLKVMSNQIVELSDSECQKVSHGMPIANSGYKNSNIVFLVYSGKIHAIGMVSNEKILVKKVFEVL